MAEQSKSDEWRVEYDCPEAAKVWGRCEGGYVVHPPSEFDQRVGESRRLHVPCPIHNPGGYYHQRPVVSR